MFIIEEIEKAYKTLKSHVKEIKIGGIIFLASIVVSPGALAQTPEIYYQKFSDTVIEQVKGGSSPRATQILKDIFDNASERQVDVLMKKWTSEINELSAYEYDWDGEGAEKIQTEALDLVKRLLEISRPCINKLDDIYATPLGSLCMQWKNEHAIINAELSSNGIAYYHDMQGDGNVNDYIRSKTLDPDFTRGLLDLLQ